MVLTKQVMLHAYEIIVDINGFTGMVERSEGNLIAQFIRDVLSGGIGAVEESNGLVLGFMGDAFFGVLPAVERTFEACVLIAKNLDQQRKCTSGRQEGGA